MKLLQHNMQISFDRDGKTPIGDVSRKMVFDFC